MKFSKDMLGHITYPRGGGRRAILSGQINFLHGSTREILGRLPGQTNHIRCRQKCCQNLPLNFIFRTLRKTHLILLAASK